MKTIAAGDDDDDYYQRELLLFSSVLVLFFFRLPLAALRLFFLLFPSHTLAGDNILIITFYFVFITFRYQS